MGLNYVGQAEVLCSVQDAGEQEIQTPHLQVASLDPAGSNLVLCWAKLSHQLATSSRSWVISSRDGLMLLMPIDCTTTYSIWHALICCVGYSKPQP